MVLINDNSSALQIGDPLPNFALPATDGNIIRPEEIKDSVLVIIFTCNHCPYAQAYEERIKALAEEGFQIILINSNDATSYPEDSFENMKLKHEEWGYIFPYCFDEDQSVAKTYGALCTPHCFVGVYPERDTVLKGDVLSRRDQNRVLQYKGRIDDNWEDPENVTERNLEDAIKALKEGKKPTIQEANAIGCSIKWK
jgi:peroxiredoxin